MPCGLARVPLTDEMLTITPPPSWVDMIGCTAWQKFIGAMRFRATIFSLKPDDALADSAGGAPPALFTSTSSRPDRSTAAATTAARPCGDRRGSA